ILSRCLQFNLKNLSPERIVGHLKVVLEQEQVPAEESGIWALARAADGSMRDALSLTDQAIAFGDGQVTEAEVSAMLGTINHTTVESLANALAEGDMPQVMAEVSAMAEHAADFQSALSALLSLFHRLAIYQEVPDAVDNSAGDLNTIQTLASQLSKEDVQLYYQIGLMGVRDLPLAPDPRSGFEMALLRMNAFRPEVTREVNPPTL
ncbi:MAG: DNA polymerase III subunit gamma/tau, partial [bacterium]